MALNVGELFARLSLNSESFNNGLNRAHNDMREFASELAGRIGVVGGSWAVMAAAVVAAVGGASVAASAYSAKMAGDMEQTEVAFGTLLHSTEKAKEMLQELQAFASATPFEFGELVPATQKMLAYGFAARDVLPMLRTLGDASSGLNAGAEGVEQITRALGQMKAKGKVSAEEMNQLAELGINGWKYLAQDMGKTTAQVTKMGEAGQLSSAAAIQSMLSGMNAEFGGNMEKQSQTLMGKISTVMDNLKQYAVAFGNEFLLPKLKPIVDWVTANMPKMWETFVSGVRETQTAMAPIFEALAEIGLELKDVFTELGTAISMAFSTNAEGIDDVADKLRGMKVLLTGLALAIEGFNQFMDAFFVNQEEKAEKAEAAAYKYAMEASAKNQAKKKADAIKAAEDAAAAMAKASVQASDAQVKSINDVLLGTKQLHDEENKRRQDAMGWSALSNLWKTAMVAGLQASIPNPSSTKGSLTPSDIPGREELRAIADDIQKQNDIAVQTQSLLRERLGVYGV